MPTESFYKIPIPQCSLLTYLFPPSSTPSHEPLYIDAADPSHHLTHAQALDYIRRLGAGLQEHGLKKGDVVLVMSRNHIFMPVAYLGVIAAGGIFSGANPAYGVDGECNF